MPGVWGHFIGGGTFIGQVGQVGQPIDKENATPCNSLLKSTREGAIQIAPASEGANAPERPAGKGCTQSYDCLVLEKVDS